ncbi:MAG: GtrA family protein [Candidatus Levybacteria bacterium]|nr:GtrA family protein [Candidatus Levybacteria bacterium]
MKVFIARLIQWRVLRYLISGGSAVVTNLTLLFVLVHFFHVWYLLASVIAFTVSMYVSFMMQKFFTFNDYSKEKMGRQSILYFGFQVFNLCLNTLFMYMGVDLFHIPYLLSQILIAAAMAFYSFLIFKHLVFTPDIIYTENL